MARPALAKTARLLQKRTSGHPRITDIAVTEGYDETGNWRVEVTIEGLTPTLHPITEKLSFDLEDSVMWDDDPNMDKQARALRDKTLLGLRQDNARTAADLIYSLGWDFGFGRHEEAARVAKLMGIRAEGAPTNAHAHVRVDRWVADEIARRHNIGVEHLGREAMSVLLTTAESGPDQAEWLEYDNEDYSVTSTIVWKDDMPMPLVAISIDLPHGGVFFDGHRLTLPETDLPETILNAARGRRLEELVKTDTALDARIIRAAYDDPGLPGMAIELEPDVIAIS